VDRRPGINSLHISRQLNCRINSLEGGLTILSVKTREVFYSELLSPSLQLAPPSCLRIRNYYKQTAVPADDIQDATQDSLCDYPQCNH
jgi:hypothetical protein